MEGIQSKLPAVLPPLPKLRPRPGHLTATGYGKTSHRPINDTSTATIEEEGSTVSKLLMKSEFSRGSGLRKTSGSLVHSIPKFSKVRPTEKLSEVQRVLQDRILSRQRMKQQQLHQNQKDFGSSRVNSNPSEMVASNLLQNLISMQSEKNNSIRNGFVHEAKSSRESSVRRRVRKPAKEEICHFIKDAGLPEANEEEERPIEPPLSYLPRFPEVTITPACSIIQHCGTAEGAALGPSILNSNFNLATPMKPQEMTELPVEPSQYDSLNALLPLDYGYCLEDNLCMHPSVKTVLGNPPSSPITGISTTPSTIRMMPHRLITKMSSTPYPKGAPTLHCNQDQKKFSQKLTRKKIVSSQRSEPQNEVSICKFKFTGGPKPKLEEKKMLHIDSGGNFCYTSGSGDQAVTGFEYFPKEVIHANAAIVTDAFTSLSQSSGKLLQSISSSSSRFAGDVNKSTVPGAMEVIMAFESLPEVRSSSSDKLAMQATLQ